jgi:hypothetical protein
MNKVELRKTEDDSSSLNPKTKLGIAETSGMNQRKVMRLSLRPQTYKTSDRTNTQTSLCREWLLFG